MTHTILRADDSPTIRKVVELTLSETDVRVESVGSGVDALERLDAIRPDLILADVEMPEPSGYEICRRVKDSDRPVPVLLLSGTFESFDQRRARDCGADTWQVYREVTLPIIWPGIFSAMIFVFLLSWGNFYLTYSLNGTERTLPTFIFSGIAVGSSPLYPALATVIFVPALVLVIVADTFRRRAARRSA